ncbi:MAG: hypothetical protein NZ483_05235 [Verrucomicrobiae bacterium]|nr:hypothetical protein [Verrucomicrobiae bacterium]
MYSDVGAVARNGVIPLASKYYHNLVVLPDGSVTAWGYNNWGQTDVPAAATNVVAVSAGASHSLALRADGTIVGWGQNYYGQATPPASATNVIAIAVGYAYSLALRADGTLVAWGWNFGGATTVQPEATNVVAIAAGDGHGLALRADGTVVGWGLNNAGQATVPAEATNVVAIAAGVEHSMALRRDGKVIVWGGTMQTPPEVANIVAIAGGHGFCMALSADGRLFSWGTNDPGSPSQPTDYIAIAAGKQHAVALRKDGTIVAWGLNFYGPLAPPDGLVGNTRGRIVRRSAYHPGILGAHRIYYTVAGAFGGAATATRTVVVRDTTPPTITLNGDNPTIIASTNDYVEAGATAHDLCAGVAEIAGGFYHNLALKSDGTVVAWGRNDQGQLNIPADASNTVAISAGGPYSASLQADGRVLINGYAGPMFGDPTPPADATNLVAIAAGGAHFLGLTATGEVRAWGYNGLGQCNVPADAGNAIAAAAGNSFSMALRADGTVIAWGDNGAGQATVPAAATDIMDIAAGEAVALALRADGTVIGWGDNSSQQLNFPSGLSNVVAIAAGARQGLALRADGSVVGWGSMASLNTIPSNVTNAVAIACGYFHNLALLSNGQVVVWGANDYGQANVPAGLSDAITNITISGSLTGATNLITYTAVDAAGNTGRVQRVVIVTSVPPPHSFTILKQNAKVNFARPLADTASVSGVIGLAGDFAPTGKVVAVNIGGVALEFTLDAKGKARLAGGTSFTMKKSKTAGWSVIIKLGKGSYSASWTDDGLTNETVSNKTVILPVTVTVAGQTFNASKQLLYRATANKGGSAR